jgi:hypothetical protein
MTVVACHQPTFLPWLGYFYKIKQCDVFLLLDDMLVSEGKRNSYFSQAWIKNTNGEKLLLSLPKKQHPVHTLIREVRCAENHAFFVKKFLKTIDSCYHKAPYFHPHYEHLSNIVQTSYSFLYELNVALIRYCASCLQVSCEIRLSSELGSTQKKKRVFWTSSKKWAVRFIFPGRARKNTKTKAILRNRGFSCDIAISRFSLTHSCMENFSAGYRFWTFYSIPMATGFKKMLVFHFHEKNL